MSSIVFEPLVFEPSGLNHYIDQPKQNQWPQIPLIFEHQKHHHEDPHNQEILYSKNNFDQKNHNGYGNTWNFVEALSTKNEQTDQDEKVYVHPLAKKSSSILSLKSLEMCTESLGSETGDETCDEFAFSLSPRIGEEYREMWRVKYDKYAKKVAGKGNFPPPLTSISGFDNLQVTPHREGGRLVLKAATVSANNSYFHAERTEGRLRLFFEDNSPTSEDDEIEDEYENEESEKIYDDDENWVEDIGGNNENVGCEMEIGSDRPMPCRCKENGRTEWEPCWVAIS